MDESNRVVIEAWNTVLFEKFTRFKHLIIGGLVQHSDAAFARTRYAPGARVLDVGCGFGDSTLCLAAAEGERLKPQVVAALRTTLAPFVRDNGAWAPSSAWFINARRAG